MRTGAARFRLFYLTRSADTTPFRDEILALQSGGTVKIHHDQGDPAKSFDLWPVFETPNAAHIYCCGPAGLMDAVRDMTGHWSSSAVHFESFSNPAAAPRADDAGFTVRLAKSGTVIEIAADQSILDALRANGLRVPSSCESGTCGSCKTGLVAGEPDHRDLVLAAHERTDHVMVCVSRAKTAELVLDL